MNDAYLWVDVEDHDNMDAAECDELIMTESSNDSDEHISLNTIEISNVSDRVTTNSDGYSNISRSSESSAEILDIMQRVELFLDNGHTDGDDADNESNNESEGALEATNQMNVSQSAESTSAIPVPQFKDDAKRIMLGTYHGILLSGVSQETYEKVFYAHPYTGSKLLPKTLKTFQNTLVKHMAPFNKVYFKTKSIHPFNNEHTEPKVESIPYVSVVDVLRFWFANVKTSKVLHDISHSTMDSFVNNPEEFYQNRLNNPPQEYNTPDSGLMWYKIFLDTRNTWKPILNDQHESNINCRLLNYKLYLYI
jgi:hypothetical protein